MTKQVITQEVTIEAITLRGKVAQAAQTLVEARALKAQAEKAEAEARAIVLQALTAAGATKGTCKGVTVTMQEVEQPRLDSKALRAVHPKIADKFTVMSTITKVLTK
jgi:hypothetical protein